MDDQECFFRDYGLLKQSMYRFLDGFVFNYFITANFNRDITYETAMKLLKKWHKELDRKLYGEYFWKKKPRRSNLLLCLSRNWWKIWEIPFPLDGESAER